MGFSTILLERIEGENGLIAKITLNRPERRNAIDREMISELGLALDDIASDDLCRAIILTGAGDRAFASGADIAELKERGVADALLRINASMFRRVEEQFIPTIAAIRGYALGGGCELAMACDIRVAGHSAKLGQPEVGLGIIPGAGAIQRLPRLVGIGRAKELIFTGRIIDATEAERIGLVQHTVPDERVDDKALSIARAIAAQGPLAVKIAKQAINAAWGANPAFDTLDVLGQAVLFESADKHERMAAFLERRDARRKDKLAAKAATLSGEGASNE